MSDAALHLHDLRLGYPTRSGLRVVVDGLSLSLAPGEIGCLLGASGCGKSTVLRAIAGFEPVRAGRIVVQGDCVADAATSVPPERRRIGLMFQDYALFPHLDAAGNVGFGLRGQPVVKRQARVAGMLALVGLSEASKAYPHELSGGQQQRIALARALAPAPRLLLLDEPFSNLDAGTREHLAGEVRALLRKTGTTALMVTHDQGEAFAIADSVGLMSDGRILQWGSAASLYHHPADRRVGAFIGRGSVLPATALGLPDTGDVLLRPEQLRVDPAGAIAATVVACRFVGPGHVCQLRLAGGALVEVDLPAGPALAEGSGAALSLVGTPVFRFSGSST